MKEKTFITHMELDNKARQVATQIKIDFANELEDDNFTLLISPIPRGGVACSYLLTKYLYGVNFKIISKIEDAHVLIDDIIDSGATKNKVCTINKTAKFYAFYENPTTWLVFPYEITLNNEDQSIYDAIIRLMEYKNINLDYFEAFKAKLDEI